MNNPVILGQGPITIDDVVKVARKGVKVEVAEDALKKASRASGLVKKWVKEGRKIYGITTGFGALSDVSISRDQAVTLQRNILMSHASGVGNPLDEETVRAVMMLRINDLVKANSSARPETITMLADMVNRGIIPVIPEKGSVGASGDLCPLAHLSLVLLGLGEAFYNGRRISGGDALDKCGLKPMELQFGEGLALVNGTQVMTGIAALAVYDALRLCKLTDIAASMSLEVLMGSRTEFDPRIQEVRPHPGQAVAAKNMLRMTKNSEIVSSHKDCSRVQDAYTLRCSPQVHGASHDAVEYAAEVIGRELNSSTGNPLIFSETEDFLLGGNFHGQPVALAMDFMAMAVAELANISERRVERLVNPMLSGLPAFLVKDGGLNSGLMIAQYVAASLVSENKVLAHPACVDSIPTSANKEDHVSMGTIAARKCRDIIANVENVISIEMLCAAQAMDLFTNMKPGDGTHAAYRAIRKVVDHLDQDRIIHDDIKKMRALIKNHEVLAAVEKEIGDLC